MAIASHLPRRLAAQATILVAAALVAVALAAPVTAAEETVADIRDELRLLDTQIQQIREALVETGAAAGLPRSPATALQRLDQLEETLRRLTNRVEVLTNDLNRVVEDASNRVDDIEFRLTELEGGDTSLLGDDELLGGGLTPAAPEPATPAVTLAVPEAPALPPTTGDAPQLAIGEQADFDAAKAAVEAGNYAEASALLDTYLATYPGGPLASEAQFLKAEALAGQEDWRGAARGYLDAFSGAPESPTAPRALYRLAVSLGELGRTDEACLTLNEVDIRYPGSPVAAAVAEQRRALACP